MRTLFVPDSFEPDSIEHPIELPASWRWNSCERFLSDVRARAALLRVPFFWQIEPLVHEACHAVGAPLCVASHENIPVAAAALAELYSIDTIITASKDLNAFVAHALERNIRLPANWLVVHPWSDIRHMPSFLRTSDFRIYEEIHFVPGIPLLVQCDYLASEKQGRFHRVTAFPAGTKAPPEFPLSTYGTCACNRQIVSPNTG